MGMACNINGKGRAARAVSGALVTLAGAAIVWGGWPEVGVWRWLGGAVLVALGGFQLFEAWAGWCVARAMGYRTPI